MQWQIDTFGRRFLMEEKFVEFGPDTILGSAEWFDDEGRRDERYAVLKIRDGKIADMQECDTRRQALRFANRRA